MDYISMWHATANKKIKRPSLKGSENSDVVVIGGGFSGLSTGYHLQKNGYNTIILEKNIVGSGASGRNGGELISGFPGGTIKTLAKKMGFENAKKMWELSLGSINLTESIINENEIQCDFKKNGDLRPAYKPSHLEGFKRDQEYMFKNLNYDKIEIIDKNNLRQEMNTTFYHGARLNYSGAHFHPFNYVLGLAEAFEKMGGKIYEDSEALQVIHQKNKGVKVKTTVGEVNAEYVAITTNAYSGKVNNIIKRSVVPVDSIMVATEKLPDDTVVNLIKNDRAVSDSKNLLYYFRRTADNRLAFGGSGRASTTKGRKKMFNQLQKGMIEVFPQLKSFKVDYQWGGKVGFTTNMLPYIGKLEDGTHFAFGYGGRGASLATMLGKMIAENIISENNKSSPLNVEKLRPIPFHGQHAKAVGLVKYYKKFQDSKKN